MTCVSPSDVGSDFPKADPAVPGRVSENPWFVLVVDDDASVRRFLEVLFARHGVRMRAASGGEAAVEVFREHHGEVALVLSDVQMPGLDGPTALARMRAIDPDVRCWFMSGHAGEYTRSDLLDRGACGLLGKPFGAGELAAVLSAVGATARERSDTGRACT